MEKRFWAFLYTPLGKRVGTFVAIIIWIIFMSLASQCMRPFADPVLNPYM